MLYKSSVTINKDFEDEITELLFAYNAISVSSEINSNLCTITALFENVVEAHDFLISNGFIIDEITDDQWQNQWLEGYEGAELTPSVFITPSTHTVHVPGDYKHIITLDPRDAFGDGNHPTTKQCALAIESLSKILDYSKTKFIDVGTGTGVLSIIAHLNGIQNIDAIDIELESVEKTKINFKLNAMEKYDVFQADIKNFHVSKKYDIICANLLSAVITDTIDELISLGNEQSYYIFSGISVQWKNDLENLFSSKNLTIMQFSSLDDWCCYILKQ